MTIDELLKKYGEWIPTQMNQKNGLPRSNVSGYVNGAKRILNEVGIILTEELTPEKWQLINERIYGLNIGDQFVYTSCTKDNISDLKSNWKDFGNFMEINISINANI